LATDIAIYVEDKLLPPVQDILAALMSNFPEVGEVELWAETTDRTMPVLVLGNMPPITPAFHVKTLSQKQILSRPSAMTELEVALKNLLKPPVYPEMKYEVVKYLTPEQEHAIGNTLVVDIETGGNYDTQVRPEEKYLLCVGLNDGKHIYIFDLDGCNYATRGADQLVRILTKPGRKLIAHNMKFDFPILAVLLGIPELFGHGDTMLLHHSINHGAQGHALEDLCERYLGAPNWKEFAKQYTRKTHDYASIPTDVLHYYNAMDVYWTWYLWEYLLKVAASEKDRISKVALHEFKMSRFFQQVEKNGVGVNVPYLEQLHSEYDAAEIPVLARIRELADDPDFNPGSWQQVQKFFKQQGYNLKSTDEKHLNALNLKADKDPVAYEFLNALLEIRGIRKMRGTYVDGFNKRRRGNIVYPQFLVHGTQTGRTSATDPNIQNVPRDKKLRSIVVPRDPEKRTMVQVDYSQAELRVMACLSKDPYLISAFQKGSPDFFDMLMPVAYPGIDLHGLDKGVKKNMRARLKGVIYGLSYGRQAKAIAVSLTEEDPDNPTTPYEAQKIIDNYFMQATKLYDWRMWVTETTLDPTKALISPFGRQYQAEVVTGRNRQNIVNSGLAFLPQSTASDLCLTAGIEVQNNLRTGQYGDTMIVATIHDAILLDTPFEYVDAVETMVQHEMEAAGTRVFGDLVHFGAEADHGPSWADAG
jgi:DNA polymerase-1